MIDFFFRGIVVLVVCGVALLYVTVRDPNKWP
jgi:hypothetical protein